MGKKTSGVDGKSTNTQNKGKGKGKDKPKKPKEIKGKGKADKWTYISQTYDNSTNATPPGAIGDYGNDLNNNKKLGGQRYDMDDGNASYHAATHTLLKDNMEYYLGSDNISYNEVSKAIYHPNHFYSHKELDLYNKTYRFGYYNTETLSAGREFLFFTRPDLNITNSKGEATKALRSIPFFADLVLYRRELVASLQQSYKGNNGTEDYFNHLLQNQCISNLDIPGLSAQMIDTAVNDYGVGYAYRGSSESSDDNPEFSLEFKDSKWLDVYMYFKTYEYYETLKHHGQVYPKARYLENRVLHDCFSIYKFIVAEDMETIIYWGKMYGVIPKSLPRDAFSNANFDSGISFTVDFQAAFYEDMIPDILSDFNALSKNFYNKQKYNIDIYNTYLGQSDGRPATAACVKMFKSNLSPTGFVYKLLWKGSDTI